MVKNKRPLFKVSCEVDLRMVGYYFIISEADGN